MHETCLIRQLAVDGLDAAHDLLGQLVHLLLAWPVFRDLLQDQTGILEIRRDQGKLISWLQILV